jgi:hypothetical protein
VIELIVGIAPDNLGEPNGTASPKENRLTSRGNEVITLGISTEHKRSHR